MAINGGMQKINAHRDPRRLEFSIAEWETRSSDEKNACYGEMDRELDENGILVVAGVLTPVQCDHYAELLQQELNTSSHIERVMHERRGPVDGWKVYNLVMRHRDFIELASLSFTVDYMRRFFGSDMELHSSEGAIIPPGGGNLPVKGSVEEDVSGWHVDGSERIAGYYLSMISIYYLCDTSRENGATRYIPGTHKEFLSKEEALQREPRYCPVSKGDMVIFNPCLWHAGSPNTSQSNRPVIINYYQRGFVKQAFDYPGTMSVADMKKLTPDQRQLLGFNRRVPRDVSEIYRFRPELADFDPLADVN